MQNLQVVLGILIDSQDRLLLAKRPEPKFMAGYWEFPGGKIEHGETPQQALRRELQEELGIDFSLPDLHFLCHFTNHYPELSVDVTAFYTSNWHGIPQGQEGQEIQFFKRDRLPTNKILPGIDICLEELNKIYLNI